ncbi:MAG TPA: sensor histidine kinase [Streptosporangiaceae bacterium]|jgi:signal transduction histidine kinase
MAGFPLRSKIFYRSRVGAGLPGEFSLSRLVGPSADVSVPLWQRVPFGETLLTVLLAFGITLVAAESDPGVGARAIAALLLVLCWLAGLVARRAAGRYGHRAVTDIYMLVVVGMFTGAALIAMQSCAALFAIGPQAFGVLKPRHARRLVALLSVIPALRFIGSPPMGAAMVAEFCVTAVLAVTFSVTAGSWMREIIDQSAERANLIQRLRTAQADVEQLSEERGMLAERERLAREIHDTLTQGFASILMLVQGAARTTDTGTSAHEQLMIAAQTARENLAEARVLVAELAPVSLAGPLDEALKRLADRVGVDLRIPLAFSVTGTARDLPQDCEVALLRAAQEALANVRKHARARHVQLTLEYAADATRLTVSDDGVGFAQYPRADGFGLRGMHSRAQLVGGSLTVRTKPGWGTTIDFEVPVSTAEADRLVPAQQ